jgi:hypothetical protein
MFFIVFAPVSADYYAVNFSNNSHLGWIIGAIDLSDFPQTSLTVNTTSGVAPLAVQFTDTSTISETSRYWDFGDGGNASSLINVSHVYTKMGNYTAKLFVQTEGQGDYYGIGGRQYIIVTSPRSNALTRNDLIRWWKKVPSMALNDRTQICVMNLKKIDPLSLSLCNLRYDLRKTCIIKNPFVFSH